MVGDGWLRLTKLRYLHRHRRGEHPRSSFIEETPPETQNCDLLFRSRSPLRREFRIARGVYSSPNRHDGDLFQLRTFRSLDRVWFGCQSKSRRYGLMRTNGSENRSRRDGNNPGCAMCDIPLSVGDDAIRTNEWTNLPPVRRIHRPVMDRRGSGAWQRLKHCGKHMLHIPAPFTLQSCAVSQRIGRSHS